MANKKSASKDAGTDDKKVTKKSNTTDQVKALCKENDQNPADAASAAAGLESTKVEAGASVSLVPKSAEESEADPLFIVIPYKEKAASGDELKYALRAWYKFAEGRIQIVIIGDKPAWASDVIHISHKSTSPNPQVDVAQKMLLACESELIPEFFIWTNDDIYPVARVNMTLLDLHTAMGRLKQRGAPGGVYCANASRTLSALRKAGVAAPWDYATHTPVVFWKEPLSEIIHQFKADNDGYLVSTLYFNLVYRGDRPILVDNGINEGHPGTRQYIASAFKRVAAAILARAFDERIFINNDDKGWPSVEPFLKKLFSKKSAFEK